MYIELYFIYGYLHPSYVYFVDLEIFDDIWSIKDEFEAWKCLVMFGSELKEGRAKTRRREAKERTFIKLSNVRENDHISGCVWS